MLKEMRLKDLYSELCSTREVTGFSMMNLVAPVALKVAKSLVPQSLRGNLLEASRYFGPDIAGKRLRNPAALVKSDFNLQRRLWEEETRFNMQQLLHYEDRNSMAFSIEARVPFIEHRLIEFVMKVPAVYKIHNGWSKVLLRNAMEGLLPKEIQWRKDKMGFVTPEEAWINDLRPHFVKLIRQEAFRSARFADMKKFIDHFDRESISLPSSDIWRFLNLEFWMREFRVS
jgi:asparagine synthetase B (glutamine-hydrolysing)